MSHEGNKQLNQCYRYSFTFSKSEQIDQSDEEFSLMFPYIKDCLESKFHNCKYVFQLERGSDTHRLHYQGHIKLAIKDRISGLVNKTKERMPGCHFSIESTRGSTNAEFYCIKRDETYVLGPWGDSSYEMPYDGGDLISHNDFYPWQLTISEIVNSPVHPDKINWIFQPEGGCGKSSFCKWMCFHFGYPQLIVCKPADLMHLVFTTKISTCYFIDIQRTLGQDQTMDSLYSSIEQLKNGYIVNTKYVTGYKLFKKPHVIVFSNIMPNIAKLSSYKWNIYRIIDNNLVNHII